MKLKKGNVKKSEFLVIEGIFFRRKWHFYLYSELTNLKYHKRIYVLTKG